MGPAVIDRIHKIKTLTVDVHAGRATRHHKLVKKDGPDDLVFQSVNDGKPSGRRTDGRVLPEVDCRGWYEGWYITGTIKQVESIVQRYIKFAKLLERLVELVGIEPTTSSLRILSPVRDDAAPKKSE